MKRLEDHKVFPVIAWALILGFAFFTYTLITDLQRSLKAQTVAEEAALLELYN